MGFLFIKILFGFKIEYGYSYRLSGILRVGNPSNIQLKID